MAMGKSFNKSMLFVFGIVLVVSTFSGCTDVEGPDSLFTDAGASSLVGQDIQEVYSQLETAGYDIEVTTFPKSQKINTVFVYNDKGDELVIKDNDGKLTKDGILAIESAVLNPNKNPTAANPAPTDDNLGDTHEIYKLIVSGELTEEMANDILGDDIKNYGLKNPGISDEATDIKRGENINQRYTKEWFSPEFQKKFGLMEYDERYNEDGKLTKITFMMDENNAVDIYNDKKKKDEKIDEVFIFQNGNGKSIEP